MDPQFRLLLEAASRPYAAAGRYAWHFARGKLRHDPVFMYLLRHGLLPDRGSLLDLGRGQGVLLSLLKAAKAQYQAGLWPQDWPAPPLNLDLSGIELLVREAHAAAGFPFQVTKWCERIAEAGRGPLRNSLHFRSRGEWVAALEKLGLGVRVAPVSEGTPFANVLFVARRTDRKINPGPMVLMSRRGPLLERSFSIFTNFSSAISLMSTSHVGRTRRIAIMGTRLCPPARSFAPSPWRRSSSQASATDSARA